MRHGRNYRAPDLGRPWKVWDLDAELRYAPVLAALPRAFLPICEVGSGPAGLAAWTDRPVIGIDPGVDERHGAVRPPPNLRRVRSDAVEIPLDDRSVAAAVAVDTLEHIPRERRAAVVAEMDRVTADGGRIVIMGPAGPEAAAADRVLLERWRERDPNSPVVGWISEHVENGLPTVPELTGLLARERVGRITVRGVFNLKLWYTMHRATLEDFPAPPGFHHVHHLVWAPFGALARRLRRGPFYRYLAVAELWA